LRAWLPLLNKHPESRMIYLAATWLRSILPPEGEFHGDSYAN
jgi:hypothetical protein